jgi:membrane protein implicated in regulation of membrane protease activity
MYKQLALSNGKNLIQMLELKTASVLMYIFGIPLYGISLWINIGTWKSDVLAILGIATLFFNGYWRWRRNLRADKKAMQEEELRQIEIEERKKSIQ